MIRLLLICLLSGVALNLDAQLPEEIISQCSTIYEIEEAGEEYFNKIGKGKGTGYKAYRRWLHEIQIKSDRSGRMINFDLLTNRAFQRLQSNQSGDRATNGQWFKVGPSFYTPTHPNDANNLGRVNCMAFHPTDPLTFYVGTPAGGLWKTTNGGSSWTPLTDALITTGISDIIIHPSNPNTIYILTGDGDGRVTSYIGILRSTDGGLHWDPPMLEVDPALGRVGYRLIMHPTNSNYLVACLSNGLYFTYNGGVTWGLRLQDQVVYDAAFSVSSPHRLHVVTNSAVYYTDDANLGPWTQVYHSEFPSEICRKSIAISPSTPSNVYLLFGGVPGAGMFNGLFKSVNFGETYDKMSDSPNIFSHEDSGNGEDHQSAYDISLLVDPTQDNTIYTGGINQWKSTNSGTTWTRSTKWVRGGGSSDPYVHADWHNNYIYDGNQYACSDGGVYVLYDGEAVWTDITPGMCITQFYNIDVRYDKIMGGTQDNGTLELILPIDNAAGVWGGDGFGCVYHPTDTTFRFLSSQDGLVKNINGISDVMWNESNGFWHTRYWTPTNGSLDSIFVMKAKELYKADFTQDPDDIIFYNKNVEPNLPEGWIIVAFAQGTNDPNRGYVLNSVHLIKTSNLNSSTPAWSEVTTPVESAFYRDIVVSPENADRIWFVCSSYISGEKVYFSPNGGSTWENISGSLPNIPIRCILLDANSTNESIYIGTEFGIFYRNNTMDDWVNYSTYLSTSPVNEMVIYNGMIYAGTYGRGIWKSELFTCPTALNLTPGNDPVDPENIGYQEFRASSHITSTRVIGGNLSDVLYSAGNYIDLKLGFWAKIHGEFEATIDGCPD